VVLDPPETGPVLLAAGFWIDFLAGAAGAPFFAGGAAFLATAAVFRDGATFLAGGAFLAVAGTAFFAVVDTTFFAEDAGFLVVAVFFTTGTAFFFEGAGRFVAVPPTLAVDLLFPTRGVALVAGRDAGNLLTWEPLLAGVIVPSFGPLDVAGFPDDDLVRGAGDDTGRWQGGTNTPRSPHSGRD
jgi:hypothetical protein